MDNNFTLILIGLVIVTSGCIGSGEVENTDAEEKMILYLNAVSEGDEDQIRALLHDESPLNNQLDDLGAELEIIEVKELSVQSAVEKSFDRNVTEEDPRVQDWRNKQDQLEQELELDGTTVVYYEIEQDDGSSEEGLFDMVKKEKQWYIWGV